MHCALKKKREKKVRFRVKNPLEMHSTDALHLKTPCPFPLGINQLHGGKTLLSSPKQLLLNRKHFSCVGCVHVWDTTAKLGELIRSHQFKLTVIVYLSDSIRASLVVGFDAAHMSHRAPCCTHRCSLQFKKRHENSAAQ